MSAIAKIRISDISKDFGVPNKLIMTILTTHGMPPRSPAKVLDTSELNVIFNEMTTQNQVADLEAALEQTKTVPAPAAPAPAPAAAPAAPVQAAPVVQPAPAAQPAQPVQTAQPAQPIQRQPAQPVQPAQPAQPAQRQPIQPAQRPQQAQQPQQPKQPKQPKQAQQPPRKPERRYVDTRGSSVDMSKFDDHADKLVTDREANLDKDKGVQKIVKKQPDRKGVTFGQKRRIEEQEKLRRLQQEVRKKAVLKVSIPDEIAVGELASRLKKTGAEVVKQLVKLGVMASLSEMIDFDTASLVAIELGAKVEREIHLTIEEQLIDDRKDEDANLAPRDPVVVVMGHVDHGKTSLLDAVRKTNVAGGEAGGITQHIGAYQIPVNNRLITFLDTPGHAAFTEMRARGASVTDIAILVVAADDGVMPQTIEAINHAKAAKVPIIVAVNKIDKPQADPEAVMRQLMEYDLVPEEWGGETIVCKVSATTGEGIPSLLEMVLLVADMQELRANPDRNAAGAVIEAKLDRARGPVATLLVQNGTLKTGDLVIAGKSMGRVRAMSDYKGRRITEAGPSMPVEIIGLDETPGAGDKFNVVQDERMAHELVLERKQQERDKMAGSIQKMTLQDLYSHIQEGELKELNIILKADVQGSIEALRKSLEELSNDEVKVRIIHAGVGAINENDVMLASASSAIVIGFNVRPDTNTRATADQKGIDLRMYRIIYECIDEVKAAIKGMLAPKFKEEMLGTAEVRQVFKVTGVGAIAGCMVKDGKVQRAAKVRVVRNGVVIHEGDLASLRRFKDDVKEVATGFECGIGIDKFNDLKEGDIIENYQMVQI